MLRNTLLLALVLYSSLSGAQENSTDSGRNDVNLNVETPIEISSLALDSIKEAADAIAINTTPDEISQQRQTDREIEALRLADLDLEAQQSMADSTWWIFIISGAGLAVGVFTLIFLGFTIGQNRSLIRQDRAWMAVSSDIKNEPFDTENGEPGGYLFTIEIQNVGETPAINAYTSFFGFSSAPSTAEIEKFMLFVISNQENACVIGQGHSSFMTVKVPDGYASAIMEKRAQLFVYTFALYQTIYGETFLTERTMRLDIDSTAAFRKEGKSERQISFVFVNIGMHNHIVQLNKAQLSRLTSIKEVA